MNPTEVEVYATRSHPASASPGCSELCEKLKKSLENKASTSCNASGFPEIL